MYDGAHQLANTYSFIGARMSIQSSGTAQESCTKSYPQKNCRVTLNSCCITELHRWQLLTSDTAALLPVWHAMTSTRGHSLPLRPADLAGSTSCNSNPTLRSF